MPRDNRIIMQRHMNSKEVHIKENERKNITNLLWKEITMNTNEENNARKEVIENESKKLNEMTEEELEKVSGGRVDTQNMDWFRWNLHGM